MIFDIRDALFVIRSIFAQRCNDGFIRDITDEAGEAEYRIDAVLGFPPRHLVQLSDALRSTMSDD